jgi:NAD(P)-dependent dehydrogenase (short-subunit alcohol dehydrogenase family)
MLFTRQVLQIPHSPREIESPPDKCKPFNLDLSLDRINRYITTKNHNYGVIMNTTTNFKSKVALITGASGGLGMEFAMTLAKAGARVIIASRRNEMLDELRAKIEAEGGIAHAIALDITNNSSIQAAIAKAETEVGNIDILINNAGVNSRSCELLEITLDEYEYIMNTNLRGLFFVSQEVAKRMIVHSKKQPDSHHRIINIASISGMKAFSGFGIYGASKAGVIHLTKAMATEWGQYGISVNAICPGLIRTAMTSGFLDSNDGQQLTKTLPRNRVGEPGFLSSLLLMLAADESHFINGSIIKADDGFLS